MANLRNVATWPDTILAKVAAKLVTDALFAAEYVLISTSQDQGMPPPADRYAVLVLGPQRPDQGIIAGGGNTTPIFNGELGLILWNRLSLDQPQRDDAFVTDSSLGAWALMRRVLKSLQLFDPQNPSTDYYLTEPMRLSDSGWLTRPRKAQPGWGSVDCSWSFQYLADLVS